MRHMIAVCTITHTLLACPSTESGLHPAYPRRPSAHTSLLKRPKLQRTDHTHLLTLSNLFRCPRGDVWACLSYLISLMYTFTLCGVCVWIISSMQSSFLQTQQKLKWKQSGYSIAITFTVVYITLVFLDVFCMRMYTCTITLYLSKCMTQPKKPINNVNDCFQIYTHL